jgi:transcriptional regulator with XRE-family HTH domain
MARCISIGMERSAEIIKQLRLARGLTKAQACRLADLPQATWSGVESGSTSNPHSVTKVRIARALGVTPTSIWRQAPRPLHLEDVEDPRWEPAVRSLARRLAHAGAEERQRFGKRLVAVLDCVDRGPRDAEPGHGRWDEFWQLGIALTLNREAPITIVDGKLVEHFAPATRVAGIAATRSDATTADVPDVSGSARRR